MNSGLTSHQQRGHTETGPRFKVSSERPEKRGIDLATPGLVVQRVIHYTTAAPIFGSTDIDDATYQVSRSLVNWLWRRFFKVFTIYGHGGHLSQVTRVV